MKYKLKNGKEIDLQAIAYKFAELAKSEPKDDGEKDAYYFPHELAIAKEWHDMGMEWSEGKDILTLVRGKDSGRHFSAVVHLFSSHKSIRALREKTK